MLEIVNVQQRTERFKKNESLYTPHIFSFITTTNKRKKIVYPGRHILAYFFLFQKIPFQTEKKQIMLK